MMHGKVMSSHFNETRLEISTMEYLKIRNDALLLCVRGSYVPNKGTIVQVSAPIFGAR